MKKRTKVHAPAVVTDDHDTTTTRYIVTQEQVDADPDQWAALREKGAHIELDDRVARWAFFSTVRERWELGGGATGVIHHACRDLLESEGLLDEKSTSQREFTVRVGVVMASPKTTRFSVTEEPDDVNEVRVRIKLDDDGHWRWIELV